MKKALALILVLAFAFSMLAGCASKPAETTAAPAAGETTAAAAETTAAAASGATFKDSKVRVVIGSTATSGDSYMNAEIAWRYLAKELGADSKVDAVGAGPAFEALFTAKPDGSTVMEFHDMTYLGISFGAFDSKYALENLVIGPRLSVNPGSCFAATKDAPYADMKEMADYLKANPDAKVRVAAEAGGVSHIGFIAYYEWLVTNYGQEVADRVRVITLGSTDEKLQAMWDGNVDVIFADYSSLREYTEEGVDAQLAVKFVGMLDEIPGLDLPTYANMGITVDGQPFKFSKDFIIYLPKGTPAELVAELDKAAEAISTNEEFKAEMGKLYYEVAFMPAAETATYITAKRDALDALIKRSPSMDDLTVQ